MKKWVRIVLLFIFSALFVFAAWKIIDIRHSYKVGEQAYSTLEQYVSFSDSVPSVSDKNNTPEKDDSAVPSINWPQVDFARLAQINPDVVGWIFIEGTNINYPIAQAADNNYYLTRLFDGTYNYSGSIFLDASASSDFSDQHSIIFGHNMKNDTMFASLMDYYDPTFYAEHPEILLLTPSCNYLIRIFSGHTADSSVNAWERTFDDISFEKWLSAVTELSKFSAKHRPQSDDLIVSLSTCSYDYDDARFLLHGYIAYKESVHQTGN